MKINDKMNERIKEIEAQMNSFSKQKYDKDALLEELLLLQSELRNIVFNDEHAKNAELRIWNVSHQLEELNKQKGNIADQEVKEVVDQCKYIGNLISALISGVAGEKKAYHSLLNMNCKKYIHQNVELKRDGVTTELDDVVITPQGIFIVEVKNTGKNITIDEKGNFFREGEVLSFDCNIGEKMNYKEALLKEVLKDIIPEVKVHSILVFTNSTIQVKNNYQYIQHCFLGQLPHVIEEFSGDTTYTRDEIFKISEVVENARSHEEYPVEIDIDAFKKEFARVLAFLELVETREPDEEKDTIQKPSKSQTGRPEIEYWKQHGDKVAIAVAGLIVGGLTALIIKR